MLIIKWKDQGAKLLKKRQSLVSANITLFNLTQVRGLAQLSQMIGIVRFILRKDIF